MSQPLPAQPGQDANAGAITPAAPAVDNSHQIEASGASARLRQDAGLPAVDNTKDATPVTEPAADGKLRDATPGFESVPTAAREVNSSARAIDNMNNSGPVRVREASFSTADGQTLSGNIYPKGGNEVFMSKDGQKYNVDKNAQGDIALKPVNGAATLAVQENSIRPQGNKPVPGGFDGQAVAVNVNAAGVTAERSAAQQAQQQRVVAEQQRMERYPEQQKVADQTQINRLERPERQDRSTRNDEVFAERPVSIRPDKSVPDDLAVEHFREAKNESAPQLERYQAPIAGSGSASSEHDISSSRNNAEHAARSADGAQPILQNAHGVENQNVQANIIKVGEDVRRPLHFEPASPVLDKQFDQAAGHGRDKAEEKSLETPSSGPSASMRSSAGPLPKVLASEGVAALHQGDVVSRAMPSPSSLTAGKPVSTSELAGHAAPEKGAVAVGEKSHRESDLVTAISAEILHGGRHHAEVKVAAKVENSAVVGELIERPEVVVKTGPLDKSDNREAKENEGAIHFDTAAGANVTEPIRHPDLKDEEGIIATGTDNAAPLGTRQPDLEEKDKHKKDDQVDEVDTLNTRNAMIATMLTDKAKKEASEKEEQLAINDSKKKGEDKRRRYVVKDKDTLESIAKKQLRDIRLAALIYEINKHMLPLRMEKGKQVAEPRSGTSIWLPSDADIRDFRGRLYSGHSGSSSPAPPGRTPSQGKNSTSGDLADKYGDTADVGHASSAVSAGMMDAAVAKSQARQSNIEKVLGPIASAKVPEGGRIRYIVRLSDTIDGVAIKHPALKDVELWPLLARLNDLTDDIDSRGRPVAELRRGMVLDIPSPVEIEAFRAGEEFEQEPPDEVATVGLPAAPATRIIDLDAPTVKVPPLSPAEAPNVMPGYSPGVPTVPIQSVSPPLQQPSPQPSLPSLPLPSGQEPVTEPLPSSLFQSYQSGQPTMPLRALDAPSAGALPSTPAPVLSSPPPAPATQSLPATPPSTSAFPTAASAAQTSPLPAVDPLTWKGAQSITAQNEETHILPRDTSGYLAAGTPVLPQNPPQAQTPSPSPPLSPQTAGHPLVSGPNQTGGHPVVAGPNQTGGHPVVAGPNQTGGHPVVAGPNQTGGHPVVALTTQTGGHPVMLPPGQQPLPSFPPDTQQNPVQRPVVPPQSVPMPPQQAAAVPLHSMQVPTQQMPSAAPQLMQQPLPQQPLPQQPLSQQPLPQQPLPQPSSPQQLAPQAAVPPQSVQTQPVAPSMIESVSQAPSSGPPVSSDSDPGMLGGWQQTTSSLVRLELEPAQPETGGVSHPGQVPTRQSGLQGQQLPAPQQQQNPAQANLPRGAQPVPLQPSTASRGAQPNSSPPSSASPGTTTGAPSPGSVPTTVEPAVAPLPVVKPVNRPSAADLMKRAPIVVGDRYMWELDRSVRLVKSAVRWDPAIGVFRSQLEVLYRDTWYPVIFYEVFPQGSVRHEYIGGGKRKSVKMDLPPSAVQELADNDLVNNWQAYCQRFVHQLISQK